MPGVVPNAEARDVKTIILKIRLTVMVQIQIASAINDTTYFGTPQPPKIGSASIVANEEKSTSGVTPPNRIHRDVSTGSGARQWQ